MCLGVPGQVIAIEHDPSGMAIGKVNFAGVTKRVCLEFVPGAQVGDYVVVHVGFAISTINAEEAEQVFSYLRAMNELNELEIPQPDDAPARSMP